MDPVTIVYAFASWLGERLAIHSRRRPTEVEADEEEQMEAAE